MFEYWKLNPAGFHSIRLSYWVYHKNIFLYMQYPPLQYNLKRFSYDKKDFKANMLKTIPDIFKWFFSLFPMN